MAASNGWTRQQLLAAFALYCRIPFGMFHAKNPEIITYAKQIGRTPSALAMKLSNFASLDPAITASGRKGLEGASAADKKLWNEAQLNWGNIEAEAEEVIKTLIPDVALPVDDEVNEIPVEDFSSEDKFVLGKIRIGQRFFRKRVLRAYDFKCCITGLSIPRLLVASHIVPWRHDITNRLNPMNGLALSMLHDRAFDLGIITINEDMTVRVSKKVSAIGDEYFQTSLRLYDGKPVASPIEFSPKGEFLQHHRERVFEKWEGNI